MREVINTHDQLMAAVKDGWPREHALAISKDDRGGGALVYSPCFKTDPKAAWYRNGQKAFWGEGGAVSRWKGGADQAKEWVKETYGYDGKWVGNRMRDLVPAEINKKYPLRKVT